MGRVFLLLTAVWLMALPVAARDETGFLNRNATIDGETYRYVVFVPADWTASKKWPVILFLHGAGERGDDGLLQSEIGLPSAIRRAPTRFPAVVVIPQCRTGSWWTAPAMVKQSLAALDASMKEFNGDADRTYLTGLSMGGYGTWAVASQYPERFAAVAPVCGGIRLPGRLASLAPAEHSADPYADTAKKIGATPVWVFHGAADPTVPVAESQKMVEAFESVRRKREVQRVRRRRPQLLGQGVSRSGIRHVAVRPTSRDALTVSD